MLDFNLPMLLPRAAEVIGYSVKAMELKIERGVWLKGEVWDTAPDGRRVLLPEGYRRWVARGRA